MATRIVAIFVYLFILLNIAACSSVNYVAATSERKIKNDTPSLSNTGNTGPNFSPSSTNN